MDAKILYGIPEGGSFRKGAELSETGAAGTLPVLVKSFETATIEGKTYLLAEKPVESYIGCVPDRRGGYTYLFKSGNQIIQRDTTGNAIPTGDWIAAGVRTNLGRVVETGEKVAVIEDETGKRFTAFRKSLSPVLDDSEAMHKAETFRMELEKSLNIPRRRGARQEHSDFVARAKGWIKTPKAAMPTAPARPAAPAQPAKPAQPAAPAAPAAPAGGFRLPRVKVNWGKGIEVEGEQPKSETPSGKISFGGLKATERQPQEGDTRSFGVNDMRTLKRASNGELRWMNADELREENEKIRAQAKAEGKDVTQPEAKPERQFRVGDTIPHNGDMVQVVDHSDSLIAVKKPDGTTETVPKSQYNPQAEQEKAEQVEKPAQAENEHPQHDTRLEPHPDATGETHQREIERIWDEQTQTEGYKAFQARNEKGGWKREGESPFEFTKEHSLKVSDHVFLNERMRRVWLPEKNDYTTTFNDRPITLSYNGEDHELVDVNGDTYTLRKDGKETDAEWNQLDEFKGVLTLDEDGNASVRRGGKYLGELSPSKLISQKDLLSADTIKIINDTVYGSINGGDGARVENVFLGKIANVVTVYKHGDEIGVIDGHRKTTILKKGNVRRDVPSEKLDAGQRKVQADVQRFHTALDATEPRRTDVEIAKARVEGEAPQGAKKQRSISRSDYQDVFDKYRQQGGEQFDELLAESHGNPDSWNANVNSLAELMKAKDADRKKEIEAFNAISKGGVLKAVPEARPMDEYREAAADMLRAHRNDYLRGKTTDRGGMFDWGETAEVPEYAKAVSGKVQKIRDSRNQEYYVQYAVVPMDKVVQSHEVSGEKSAEHPEELQARLREEAHSTAQMRKISENINDDVVTDSADATRGAPVVYSKGGKAYVTQGNGRAAGIKGTQGDQRKKYHDMLVNKAKELGIPTDAIGENDMLVRVMTPTHTYQDARYLASFGQDAPSIPMTEVERARAHQNANSTAIKFENLNLEGVGNRAIDEGNVATFIQNNPQMYRQMLEQSGFTREAVESHPKVQAQIVNTAILAQLNKDFIQEVSKKGDRVHNLVKRIAPVLAANKRDISEGKLPVNADMQKYLTEVIKGYDSLDAGTKALMTNRNGQIDFLNEDPNNDNPKTLIHQMRQEDLMSAGGKEENRFRDPLHVIGLIAYHQAMNPRLDAGMSEEQVGAKRNQAMMKFALGMKRYGEALKRLQTTEGDMFGSMLTPEERRKQDRDMMLKIAERTLLEGGTFDTSEMLSAEEQELAKEQTAPLGVTAKMRDYAGRFGYKLAGDQEIKKSLWLRIYTPQLWREHREDCGVLRKAQLGLFGEEAKIGDTKTENGETYRLEEETARKPRWHRTSKTVPVPTMPRTKEREGYRIISEEEVFAPKKGEIGENVSSKDVDFVRVELQKTGYLMVKGTKITDPSDVAYLCRQLADSTVEKFMAIPMDEEGNILTVDTITVGTLNSSLAHPREALQGAIMLGAKRIAFVHNHPSGNSEESSQDSAITKVLGSSCEKAGIKFEGHVIIAGDQYGLLDANGVRVDTGNVPQKRMGEEAPIPLYRKQKAESAEMEQRKRVDNETDLFAEVEKVIKTRRGVWVVAMGSQNRIIGVHQIADDANITDKSQRKVMEAITKNGSSSLIFYVGLQESGDTTQMRHRTEEAIQQVWAAVKDLPKAVAIPVFDVVAEIMGGKEGKTMMYRMSGMAESILNSIQRFFGLLKSASEARQ